MGEEQFLNADIRHHEEFKDTKNIPSNPELSNCRNVGNGECFLKDLVVLFCFSPQISKRLPETLAGSEAVAIEPSVSLLHGRLFRLV